MRPGLVVPDGQAPSAEETHYALPSAATLRAPRGKEARLLFTGLCLRRQTPETELAAAGGQRAREPPRMATGLTVLSGTRRELITKHALERPRVRRPRPARVTQSSARITLSPAHITLSSARVTLSSAHTLLPSWRPAGPRPSSTAPLSSRAPLAAAPSTTAADFLPRNL